MAPTSQSSLPQPTKGLASSGRKGKKRSQLATPKSPKSPIASPTAAATPGPSATAGPSSSPAQAEQSVKRRRGKPKWTRARKTEQRKAKSAEAQKESSGVMGVIDLTELDDDEDVAEAVVPPSAPATGRRRPRKGGDGDSNGRGDPGPKTKRSRLEAVATPAGKASKPLSTPSVNTVLPPPSAAVSTPMSQTAKSKTAKASKATTGSGPLVPQNPATPLLYTPTAFTPMRRSMASGYTAGTPSPPPPAAAVESVAAPTTGDIVIEEKLRDPAPANDINDNGVAKHFNPPGLFSSSFVPTSADLPPAKSSSNTKALSSAAESSITATKQSEAGLLLPAHVQIDEALPEGAEAVEEKLQREEAKQSMEGLYVFDTDVARGTTRYFDPDAVEEPKGEEATFLATADQSRVCTNCKKPGHKPRDCPHVVCTTCGEMDSHERRDCPFGITCFACGQRGHRSADCPNPTTKRERLSGCSRCGVREHKDNSCPTLWRIYVYVSAAARQSILSEKRKETGWAKEAVGGDAHAEFCYNCAREGHLGDDCPNRRSSLMRLNTPSAFSAKMSNSGPFAALPRRAPRSTAPATHQRFDENDEEESINLPGLKPAFAGLGAGRKSREKARKRAADLDRDAGSSDDEEEFLNRVRPEPKGGRGFGRGGSNGGTPISHPARRAWDSEYKEREREVAVPMRANGRKEKGRDGNMPFSHSHLMSTAFAPASVPVNKTKGGIVFGNIGSLPNGPDSPSPFPNSGPGGSGPNGTRGSGSDWQNRASKALTDRAMGYASAPTSRSRSPAPSPLGGSQDGDAGSPRKRRRRQADFDNARRGGEDKDWEVDWRGGGNGGGNVQDWGKEDDEFDRKERREAAREGKEVKGDGGSRYGIAGGGRGKGGAGSGRGRGGGRGGGVGGGGSSWGGSGSGNSGQRGGKQGPATPVGQRYTGGY